MTIAPQPPHPPSALRRRLLPALLAAALLAIAAGTTAVALPALHGTPSVQAGEGIPYHHNVQ